jgi:hypothetical protein
MNYMKELSCSTNSILSVRFPSCTQLKIGPFGPFFVFRENFICKENLVIFVCTLKQGMLK